MMAFSSGLGVLTMSEDKKKHRIELSSTKGPLQQVCGHRGQLSMKIQQSVCQDEISITFQISNNIPQHWYHKFI